MEAFLAEALLTAVRWVWFQERNAALCCGRVEHSSRRRKRYPSMKVSTQRVLAEVGEGPMSIHRLGGRLSHRLSGRQGNYPGRNRRK